MMDQGLEGLVDSGHQIFRDSPDIPECREQDRLGGCDSRSPSGEPLPRFIAESHFLARLTGEKAVHALR
jgi:hypothetical protein